jgi:hypothetical protein
MSQEALMRHVFLPVLGLCTAVAALVIALSARGGDEAVLDAAVLSRLSSDVSVTRLRFDDIEERLHRIESAQRDDATSRVASKRFSPDTEEHGSLAERIARLERSLAEVAESKRDPAQPRPRAAEDPVIDDADVMKAIAKWHDVARSSSAPETERLEALRGLRGARLPDGTDARLAVVDDMVRLAETSADAEVRADVWRQLSHMTEQSMLSPLLSALRNDSVDKVREEAAETLADFLPDERVRRALQHAAENDPSNRSGPRPGTRSAFAAGNDRGRAHDRSRCADEVGDLTSTNRRWNAYGAEKRAWSASLNWNINEPPRSSTAHWA